MRDPETNWTPFTFTGEGKLNDQVYGPPEDEKVLFEPRDDMWLARLIFWGVGIAAFVVFLLVGFFYEPHAFLGLPVVIIIGVVLWFVCPHWVWRDAKKV